MILSIRTNEEIPQEKRINSLKEAQESTKKGFLIVCNHDSKKYIPCKKIPLKEIKNLNSL